MPDNITYTKNLRRLLLSFSNVSRGLLVSVFGLIVNYLLLHYKSKYVLDGYVYCVSIVNLGIVLVNWGGKDYGVKTLTANPAQLGHVTGALISSRLILFVLPAVIVLLTGIEWPFKLFICFYLLLKALNAVVEALVIVQKRYFSFLLVDVVLGLALVLLMFYDGNKADPGIFLLEVLLLEFIRATVSFILFKRHVSFGIDWRKGWKLIADSRQFFYLALTGFVCSRIDLYMVGIVLDKHAMSYYFILLNLVSLSQVTYATLISTFSSNIFRFGEGTFKKFAANSLGFGFIFAVFAAGGMYLVSNYYYELKLDRDFVWLMFMNVFFFTQLLTQMYHYTRVNRQKTVLWILVVSGCLNICLSFVLTGPLGLKGAFISNTACVLCTMVLLQLYARHGRG